MAKEVKIISEEEIIERLKCLMDNKQKIHITIDTGRRRIDNAECVIVGLYNHFLIVETMVKHYKETLTFKIVDIKIGYVKILELGL